MIDDSSTVKVSNKTDCTGGHQSQAHLISTSRNNKLLNPESTYI